MPFTRCCIVVAGGLSLGQAPDGPAKIDRLVVSENGRFEALIRRAKGQEEIDVALARWMVEVAERTGEGKSKPMWTARYPYRGDAMEYRLAEDGSAIAAVARVYNSAQPIVMVHRLGQELVKYSGADLIDEPKALPLEGETRTWLAQPRDAIAMRWVDDWFGPEQRLVLETFEGPVHVRLASGELVSPTATLAPIAVEPELVEETKPPSVVPYVSSIEIPRAIDAGSVLEFQISGHHATPGWSLAGYLAAYDPGERVLLLETRARYFPQGRLAAQVLQPFRYPGRLRGLPVGKVRVRLATGGAPLEDVALEVLPQDLLLRLHRSGGIAGLDETLELFRHGLKRVTSNKRQGVRHEYVDAVSIASFEQALLRLEPSSSPALGNVSDRMGLALDWWRAGSWVSCDWSDPGPAPAGPLFERLLQLF